MRAHPEDGAELIALHEARAQIDRDQYVGLEIAGALSLAADGTPVALVVSGGLGALYGAALSAAGLAPTVIDADTAVRNGLAAGAKALWSL